MAGTHCGEEHGRVVTRIDNLEEKLAKLEGQVESMRTLVLKIALAVLTTAAAGSSLAPVVTKIVTAHLSGG